MRLNLDIYTRRTLFELHAGRGAPQAPTDLPLEHVIPPSSQKNDDWHTTSEDLIQALGPIGQEYANSKELSCKVDLSYTDAIAVAIDPTQAKQQAAANAAVAKKITKWPSDLKGALVRYLREIAPLVEYSERMDWTLSAGPRTDRTFLNFANDWPLRYLRRYGLGITDLMNWAWILTASSPDRAVTRFILIRDLRYKMNVSGKSLPNVIFTFLLRRHNITAWGLRHLLLHAWSVMRGASISTRRKSTASQGAGEPDTDVDAFRKIVPNIQENGSGFQEDVFIIVIIRLLRHARRIWPAACESITALCCQYLNGLNFHKRESGKQDPARLAFIYNTILSLLAAPASIQPYVSATHQQRAQFAVLRRMNQFDPPLVVDRRGYRAVTQVQLMHKKTLREREWAHLKARSWPPWKENRTGMDANIGPDYGISRAKEALTRAEEAGYAIDDWDRAASLLSGWDTDGSPSIQTRSIFLPPLSANRTQDETAQIWANRVRATRTLNEAWGIFQSYKDTKLRQDQAVYQAIFEKLVFNARRKDRNGESTNGLMGALPGDGPEVFPNSEIPRDMVYVRTEPPNVDDFVNLLADDGVKPRGRFLAALLSNATCLSFGIRVLAVSGLRLQDISALLEEKIDVTENVDLQMALKGLPTYLFDAFIILLARCAPAYPRKNKGEVSSNFSVDVLSTPSLLSNSLVHAFRLMHYRRPQNKRPWSFLLGALARDHAIVDDSLQVGHIKQDIFSWHAILKLLKWMQQSNVHLDLEAFMKLCAGLEKAVVAVETLIHRAGDIENVDIRFKYMALDIQANALPFVKEVFKNIVRAESMQQEIPKSLTKVKAQIDREVEQQIVDMENRSMATSSEAVNANPEFDNTPNEHKTFLPAPCLLPRLLEVPRPAHLHQFIRVLGLQRDYDGLLDLVEWMALHADDIKAQVDEKPNGPRMFRRCLIATRVFLERSWTYYDIPDRERHIWIERDVDPAPKEIWRVIKAIVEETNEWGGWPSDGEVEGYVFKGRFV